MVSPYLNQPRRSRAEVMGEILSNALDHYALAIFDEGEPIFLEMKAGKKLPQLVKELADGQYDFRDGTCPNAVVRFSLRDNEAEDVTEKVAEAVLQHLIATNDPRPCPFLDETLPEWRARSGLNEEAA